MGCGEGGTLARFAELAPDSRHLLELVGITLSERQSAAAKSALPSATWLVGDMLHPLYLPPKWFHLIIAVESTEYVSEAHLPDFMYQAASLLASQGLLIIVAGSWSSHMPAADPFPHQLDSHYHTHISRSWFYPQAAREAGLLSVAEIDLAPLTMRYWQIRRDRVALRNSTGGWVENGLYQALKEGRAEYKLYVWRCP
jgi:cyclopropane fatty-acyl-phospholipid synthase-like methyltransferase